MLLGYSLTLLSTYSLCVFHCFLKTISPIDCVNSICKIIKGHFSVSFKSNMHSLYNYVPIVKSNTFNVVFKKDKQINLITSIPKYI